MAQFEVEEQRPAKTDAIEHLREDIHPADLRRWTIRHNIRTIELYRLENRRTSSCPGQADASYGNPSA